MSKIILYIATSADGFIADKDGGVDWLPTEPIAGENLGYKDLLEEISTIVMGRKSYEQIIGFGAWAWPDKKTYVLSSRTLETVDSSIEIMTESIESFITRLRRLKQTIWLLGGADLAKSFADSNDIDEIIITVIPQTLKSGIKLDLPMDQYTSTGTIRFPSGIEQHSYIRASQCRISKDLDSDLTIR